MSVGLGVALAVFVRVPASVGTLAMVGLTVGVLVGTRVVVGAMVGLLVIVVVGEPVGVLDGTLVIVGVLVQPVVIVWVMVGVDVAMRPSVGSTANALVGTSVLVGMSVAVCVSVGLLLAVGVAVAVSVSTGVGVIDSCDHSVTPSATHKTALARAINIQHPALACSAALTMSPRSGCDCVAFVVALENAC